MLRKARDWFKNLTPLNKFTGGFIFFAILGILSLVIYKEPLYNVIYEALPNGVDDVFRLASWAVIIAISSVILWKIFEVWIIRPILLIRRAIIDRRKEKAEEKKQG